MAKQPNPAVVGGFVVGAVVLAVAGVLAFGSGTFFQEELKAVAFFESSVHGLDVGAPVRYQGVQVGTVSDIQAVWNAAADEVNIPVELTFVKGAIRAGDEAAAGTLDQEPAARMKQLIDLGLRAELKMDSFVTGKLFVALAFMPDTPPRLIGDAKLPEIPTTEGGLAKLAKTVEELPIEELVVGLNETVQELRGLIGDPEIRAAIHNVNALVQDLSKEIVSLTESAGTTLTDVQSVLSDANTQIAALTDTTQTTMKDLQGLVSELRGQVGPVSESAQVTLKDLQSLLTNLDARIEPLFVNLSGSLDETRKILARVDKAAGGDYSLLIQVSNLLEEATQAARSVEQLSSYLQQHPEALLKGKE